MNVLKQATKEKLAEYLRMRMNQKIKSPNVAVSGLTGDGNVTTTPPVKSAVVRTPQLTAGDTSKGQKEGLAYDASGKARGFNMEYYARPEVKESVKKARAEQARKDAIAEKKRNSGFIGAGNRRGN
jgi:hypothetical protein